MAEYAQQTDLKFKQRIPVSSENVFATVFNSTN